MRQTGMGMAAQKHGFRSGLFILVGVFLFGIVSDGLAATRLQKVQVAIVSLTAFGGVPCPVDPIQLANPTYKTNCTKDKGQFSGFFNYLTSAAKDNKITSSEWGQIKNKKFNLKPITLEMKAFKTSISGALNPLGF